MSAADAGMRLLNDAAALWASGLLRACWQGGLFVLAVFLLCRAAPGLPAAARYWLWWLACGKLLVALFCAASIALPLLPRSRSAVPDPPSLSPAAPLRKAEANDARPGGPVVPAAPAARASQPSPPGMARRGDLLPDLPAIALPASPSPRRGTGALFLVWLAGMGGLAASALRSSFTLRRLLSDARAAGDPALIDEARRLSRALGLRGAPRIVCSERVATPFVTGALYPVVVLPDALSADEARMALAHEVAHIRRGDLRHGLLPVLARALFWFFPPAWLACRECAACREECCDETALRLTGISPARYGRLLLKMAAGNGGSAPVLGISAGFFALRRRLLRIQRLSRPASPRLRRMVAGLLALSLLGALPWRITAAGAASVAAPAPLPSRPQISYAVMDLGTLGGSYSDAYALNESGQVVGSATRDGHDRQGHAFLWENGRMRDLGVLWRTTPRSLAVDINDQGQVAASSFASSRFPHAFLWSGDRRRYLRGMLPGFEFYRPAAINDRGQVAGHAQTGASEWGALKARAFLWENGRMRDLGTLGGKYSRALALNNNAEIAGKADLVPDRDGPRTHAFLWEGGRMRDLGTLPGGRNSLAAALNDAGQVVGYSETLNATRAFVWENGAMRDLGALPGDLWSEAQSINNAGQIVGSSHGGPDGAPGRAVLWENGRILDLNERLPAGSDWTLESARAINARGQIVGQGWKNGRRHAFLLTPTLS